MMRVGTTEIFEWLRLDDLAELFTLPADPRVLALLEWCAQTRFGDFFTVTNLTIGAAYAVLPAGLVAYLWIKWRQLDGWSRAGLLLTGSFIFGCGLTHIAHFALIRDPALWMPWAMGAHAFTAVVSVVAAVLYVGLLHRLLRIPTPSEYEALLAMEANSLALLRDQRAALDAEKRSLIRELHHRVRNNLQVIIGSLRLQANQASDPCREALEQATGRINAIARVHERIYMEDVAAAHVETGTFLPTICRDLSGQFGVPVEASIDNIVVTVDEGRALGMLVNELVTNAVKHGAPPVRVTLTKLPGDGDYEVAVSDQGPGVNPAEVAGSRSLGMRLIRSTAQQLGGEVHVDGATFRVRGKHYADWPGEEAA